VSSALVLVQPDTELRAALRAVLRRGIGTQPHESQGHHVRRRPPENLEILDAGGSITSRSASRHAADRSEHCQAARAAAEPSLEQAGRGLAKQVVGGCRNRFSGSGHYRHRTCYTINITANKGLPKHHGLGTEVDPRGINFVDGDDMPQKRYRLLG
jgi:hypothetical protein